MALNVIGTWLRVASAAPDRYALLVIGNLVSSASLVFVYPVPPKLASIWFGPNEVSKACSAGTIGVQIGEAIGMLISPVFLSTSQNIHDMQSGFRLIALLVASISTATLILLFLFFQEKPPNPPSLAEAILALQEGPFVPTQVLKKLFLNSTYRLILLSNALSTGVFTTLLVLLNQIVRLYYPANSYEAGLTGVLMTVSGVIGSIITGIILDKYRNYKFVTLAALSVSFLVMVSFSFVASKGIVMVYIFCSILGLTLRSIMAIAFETVAEVTYPEPLSISSSFVVSLPIAVAALSTYLYSYLFYDVGDIYANFLMAALILLAFILVAVARFELKRHNIEQ